MGEEPSDQNTASTKQIIVLRNQRCRIAAQIEEIEQATISSHIKSNRIYSLKEEYNLLVDAEEAISSERSVDPLEVLPPELWPDIFPGTAEELLVLTLVCESWRKAVLSVPKIWCGVTLNRRCEDYLAQAITCIALSAPLKISLTTYLPLVMWREILPLIVAERTRISFLNIISPDNEINSAEALEMISDLGYLPNLDFFYIYGAPALLKGDIEPDNRSRGSYSGAEMLFKQAPSLSAVFGLVFTAEQLHIAGITKLCSVHIRAFHSEVVESLGHFPKLASLCLVEEQDPNGADKRLPRSLDSSLTSITTFDYHGLALERALRCIGPSLEALNTKYVTMRQLPDILASLQLFPRLSHLEIHIDLTNAEEFTNPSSDAICLSSITSLELYFTPDTFRHGEDEDLKERKRGQACKNLFECLVFMMPNVREFILACSHSYDAVVTYAQSLRKLWSLDFSSDTTEMDRPRPFFLPFSEQLESMRWSGVVPPLGVFNVVQSSTLRKLDLRRRIPFSLEHGELTFEGCLIPLPRSSIPPPSPFTNLRALSVAVGQPLPWDLRLFPRLETIELSGFPTAIRAGDFFEELLLQPASCPFLEEITIRGHYVEWDLLILMLERRNFGVTPGTANIKAIQLENNISYKLLRPISEILHGKYSHRDSIEEFSSTAMGKLLWDPLVPGCEECLRTFRGCTLQPQAISSEDYEYGWYSSGDEEFGKDYPLLLEPLCADPPLPPDVAKWLAGKKERRRTFSEASREARARFYRPKNCGPKWGYYPLGTIASHSLDGAVFGHEADD